MYVRVYRYQIKEEKLKEWQAITDAANQIYREYGVERLEKLIHRAEGEVEVMELGYYETKEEYEEIAYKADNDERIKELFHRFKKLVNGKITEEEYAAL